MRIVHYETRKWHHFRSILTWLTCTSAFVIKEIPRSDSLQSSWAWAAQIFFVYYGIHQEFPTEIRGRIDKDLFLSQLLVFFFQRKCKHFVDFPEFKRTKEMCRFPMNFTLRFWICSSFHGQNETREVKNHNLCYETEQNVPMNFYVKGTAEEPASFRETWPCNSPPTAESEPACWTWAVPWWPNLSHFALCIHHLLFAF